MKTTKTIDVWICDSCGDERQYKGEPCRECGTEICFSCSAWTRVHIENRAAQRVSGGMTFIKNTEVNSYDVRWCLICAHKVTAFLEQAGIQARG